MPAVLAAPRVSVVIAALDEATSIGAVIDAVRPHAHEVIVVDGHSGDDTVAVARRRGATVLTDSGRGKGDAVRHGARHASGEIVVFIDADGSHDVRDLPALVAPIAAGEADLVIASRLRGGSDEMHSDVFQALRLIGSTVITQAINLRFGTQLSDYQNGYRAVRRTALEALALREDATTIEQEMAIAALRRGFVVREVASHEWARRTGISKINVFRVAHRYLLQLLRDLPG